MLRYLLVLKSRPEVDLESLMLVVAVVLLSWKMVLLDGRPGHRVRLYLLFRGRGLALAVDVNRGYRRRLLCLEC